MSPHPVLLQCRQGFVLPQCCCSRRNYLPRNTRDFHIKVCVFCLHFKNTHRSGLPLIYHNNHHDPHCWWQWQRHQAQTHRGRGGLKHSPQLMPLLTGWWATRTTINMLSPWNAQYRERLLDGGRVHGLGSMIAKDPS